jgi:hypothetical protein
MPRIPETIAECVFYVYPSEASAKRGQDAGGSGFLVHIPAFEPSTGYVYAVTNKHLIDGGCCVLRLNRMGGDTDTIVTKVEDWFLHPDGDDVAVYPLEILDGFKWASLPLEWFADHESLKIYNIGYGDDVYLVGRLIAQSGRQKNTPVVRFGNISLPADPAEPVKYGSREQEAHLIECRSISGFSGSPVFVTAQRFYSNEEAIQVWEYRQKKHPGIQENRPSEISRTPKIGLIYMPWPVSVGPLLLGIDFGHLPHWNEVFRFPPNTRSQRPTDMKAQSNTGIAGVVPCWKIMDILYTPKLIEKRTKDDEALKNKPGPTAP